MIFERLLEQISTGTWTSAPVVFAWLIRKQIEKQVVKRVRKQAGTTGLLGAQGLTRCVREQAEETYR